MTLDAHQTKAARGLQYDELQKTIYVMFIERKRGGYVYDIISKRKAATTHPASTSIKATGS